VPHSDFSELENTLMCLPEYGLCEEREREREREYEEEERPGHLGQKSLLFFFFSTREWTTPSPLGGACGLLWPCMGVF